MEYTEITFDLSPSLADIFIGFLFELEILGIDESFLTTQGKLRVFIAREKESSLLSAISQWMQHSSDPAFREIRRTVQHLKDEDWQANFRKFFKAQDLTRTFFLKPLGDPDAQVPSNKIPILMEAGLAFGTGLHASTRLSLLWIEHLLSHSRLNIRFLDIGTGTGILSIAAAHLGVKDITAIDIDPIAVEVANENFRNNHCLGIQISATAPQEIEGEFDIVVANILLDVHLNLMKEYTRLVRRGGNLVLSGLLFPQVLQLKEVIASRWREHWVIESWNCLEDWGAVQLFRR